ncbi:MAG: hypothetical protein IJS16_04630 [Butyrivibrio sp.]|nr:hypothetical protein [Butyrivibrio sp.]
MYDDLKNQLGQGIPVVWAMFDWNNGVNPLAKDVVPYYTYDDTTNTYDVAPEKGAASHYVVATGLYEKVNDDGSVKRTVEISTWGRKRYVDYDEYVNFVSGTGENCFFSSITNTTLN